MKHALFAIPVVALFALCAIAGGQKVMSGQDAYGKMQALVGSWEAKLESGGVIRVDYKRMSTNSILVENFKTPSGKETLSVYHMDGERLLLTHYCGQGNQPRLLFNAKQSGTQNLVFTFLDATNLPSTEKEHMVRLEVRFVDGDHFGQVSTYRAGKEEETTTLHFGRVSQSPAN